MMSVIICVLGIPPDIPPQVLVGRKALSLAALAIFCLPNDMVDMYQIHVNVHSLLHLYDFLRKALAWDGLGWGMVCNNRDTLIQPTHKGEHTILQKGVIQHQPPRD